jgi:hypothetical protein
MQLANSKSEEISSWILDIVGMTISKSHVKRERFASTVLKNHAT